MFTRNVSLYFFHGAPELLFTKKHTPSASSSSDGGPMHVFDDFELFEPELPHVATQVIGSLHFLAVAKIIKSLKLTCTIPNEVKCKGLLLKRKDQMIMSTMIV